MTLAELKYVTNADPLAHRLIAIDRLVDACRDRVVDSQKCVALIIGILSNEASSEGLSSIRKNSLDGGSVRLAALSILRCAEANNAFWEDLSFRHLVMQLSDEGLSYDLYKILKLEEKSQTYEKLEKLQSLYLKKESEMVDLIASWNTLSATANFRHQFMSLISSQVFKILIWPFLPERGLRQKLEELFVTTIEYLEPDGQRVQDVVDRLQESLHSVRSEFSHFGTYHSISLLIPFVDRLSGLLAAHLADNPICKPAKVVVEKPYKKYPLQLVGASVNLTFSVKNLGRGRALEVCLVVKEITDISLTQKEAYLGNLDEGVVAIDLQGRVESAADIALLLGEVSWFNFDGTPQKEEFEFMILGQRGDVDWTKLSREDPYSMEPVTNEADLIGRKDVLDELIARAQASSVGSSYVVGQKRVGKTSLVSTLRTELHNLKRDNFYVMLLEGGDYTHPDALRTVEALGTRICSEMQYLEPRLATIQIPTFNGSLSPVSEFLLKATRAVSPFRLLIILDEFDELPLDLYKRGSVGDAFFLALRAISGKPDFGFVLVGSEKMEWILSCQGDALNKFQAVKVDYFERETHWSDFKDLVCRPVLQWLEISDEALVCLHDLSAGNPYFTKLICRSLVKLMHDRRDSHVTSGEIQEANRLTLKKVYSNSFQHFWEDGIFQTGEKAEEISVMRRKLLISLGEALRQNSSASLEEISANASRYGMSVDVVAAELREFERRGVLLNRDGMYSCKVPLFQEWLQDAGIKQIITTFIDSEAMLLRRREEDEAYVSSEEIVELVTHWTPYKGRSINEERVRAWLQQFGDNLSQRLMWKMLSGVTYYTGDLIRSKMREAHGIIHRDLVWRKEPLKEKRADIVVSYLGSPGKSGAIYAKLFADENGIYYENVVSGDQLQGFLERRPSAVAVVFIDDFVGTGKTAVSQLTAYAGVTRSLGASHLIATNFVAICGFADAVNRVSQAASRLGIDLGVHVCDLLDSSHRCFHNDSLIFRDPGERERARDIAARFGTRAVKREPLGFGGCEATVIFENSCPNNTLPILWGQSKDWRPLFNRL